MLFRESVGRLFAAGAWVRREPLASLTPYLVSCFTPSPKSKQKNLTSPQGEWTV